MSADDAQVREVERDCCCDDAGECPCEASDRKTLELAAVLAQHGWEWGDGLDTLYCDCGWYMDAYVDHEEGLPERDPEKAGQREREIPVIVRHRVHVAYEVNVALAPLRAAERQEAAREALIEAAEALDNRLGWENLSRIQKAQMVISQGSYTRQRPEVIVAWLRDRADGVTGREDV